ncbi:hypothetical protein RD792_016910 [Penstemon davidsonii]|uniref:Uncharacterized protein n=1 Tax=Penstemon davidsonii TaxID=160366 RepID=A0ABR0CL60_9LAMI|nr:hypothetical protein RD792_016910 [Penstemon davidsonii]
MLTKSISYDKWRDAQEHWRLVPGGVGGCAGGGGAGCSCCELHPEGTEPVSCRDNKGRNAVATVLRDKLKEQKRCFCNYLKNPTP